MCGEIMAKSKNDQVLEDLHDTMEQLEDGYELLRAQAKTDAERKKVRDLLTAARDAYWSAADRGLKDLNDVVLKLDKDLKDTNAAIKADLKSLKDFTKTIALVT